MKLDLTKISRIEVIDENGRSYTKYLTPNQKIEFSIQDEQNTLKIFIIEKSNKLKINKKINY